MSRQKAFMIGFAATLCLMLPLALVTAWIVLTRTAPADTAKQNIPVRGPMPGDDKTVLVMTGKSEPEHFTLLRFDAVNGCIRAACLPGETVVLADGRASLLNEATALAGPAQAAACLADTLHIRIDDYLFCTDKQFLALTESFGAAHLPLAQYLPQKELHALKLDLEGAYTLALTPKMFADVLGCCHATDAARCMLRTEGYLGFLRANPDALARQLPDDLRALLGSVSSGLSAADMIDYERIFLFLCRETPEYEAVSFPGKWGLHRFEFAPEALRVAAEAFICTQDTPLCADDAPESTYAPQTAHEDAAREISPFAQTENTAHFRAGSVPQNPAAR